MREIVFAVVSAGTILAGLAGTFAASAPGRPRARELGISPGAGVPGPLNAITDVAGVAVGQVTIVRGDTVRTGVTAIRPHAGNLFREKVPGAVFVGNAFGKLAGSTQVEELGTIETPIVLTNTLAVGTALDAVVRWTLDQAGNADVRSVNAVVGETNDGTLNDIRGVHVTRDDVVAASTARGLAPSRRAEWAPARDDRLRLEGRHRHLVAPRADRRRHVDRRRAGADELRRTADDRGVPVSAAPSRRRGRGAGAPADGSCMIVVATDAPVDARDLKRIAARAVHALARTGSTYSNGSGDFAIAFSTHPSLRVTSTTGLATRTVLGTDSMSALFEAVLDATEEAVDNSLLQATDVTANGRTIHALPIDDLRALLKQYGR